MIILEKTLSSLIILGLLIIVIFKSTEYKKEICNSNERYISNDMCFLDSLKLQDSVFLIVLDSVISQSKRCIVNNEKSNDFYFLMTFDKDYSDTMKIMLFGARPYIRIISSQVFGALSYKNRLFIFNGNSNNFKLNELFIKSNNKLSVKDCNTGEYSSFYLGNVVLNKTMFKYNLLCDENDFVKVE